MRASGVSVYHSDYCFEAESLPEPGADISAELEISDPPVSASTPGVL